MKPENNFKGFTLIELLLVIAIITILTTLIVLALNPAASAKRNRDYQRLTDLKVLSQAIEAYYVDNNRAYPDSDAKTTTRKSNVLPTGSSGPFMKSNGSGWIAGNFGDRIPFLPLDPLNTSCNIYRYRVSVNGYYYKLDTILEYDIAKMNNSSDGGTDSTHYEVGTDPASSPISMGSCP